MLNALYFLPMQFVGLYIWSKHRSTTTKDGVVVEFLSWEQRGVVLMICTIVVLLYAVWLKNMGDPLPLLDSASTILSIVAMILMAWRYMEQWVLWIIVDIVSVAMWWIVVDENGARDVALLVMWIAYLINAVYGFYYWVKMYNRRGDV